MSTAVRWEVGGLERSDFVLPAGTVTLLLLDAEGSTRLWETAPESAAAAIARMHEVVAEAVARHRGVQPVEQGEGDSAVAAFARASDAAACALDIQRADLGVALRAGLHTGEVQLRDGGNYVGSVVNRCARIRNLGHGGQTLLSRATADLVVDTLPDDVVLRDLGEHRLRDLTRPEHVFQLGAADFPALRSLDATPNNLPSQLTSFIGREHDVAQVARLLAESRLLTLTGAGGCGKTRLALQAAADAADAFSDGVWFVDLAPLTDPSGVGAAVGGALGIKEVAGREWTDVLRDHVHRRRMLVLLDNCEHVVAACAALADALLRGCPAVTLLTTSRETLSVAGEWTWRVPNLSLPDDRDPIEIDALASSDAVALFIDRARQRRPNFSVTNETAPAVAQICQRLDGIPLAIELAAARVRVLSPQQIAAGLDDRFKMLGAGPRTAVPRHQTLRASIDSSYELLTEAERTLLRRLSIFAGSFDLDAAEGVCADDEESRWRVLETLTALVDRSLVIADDEPAAARYRMLETIRQYGAELLESSGERDGVRSRHLRHYTQLVIRTEPELATNQRRALAVLDRELDNIRAALEFGLHGEPETGARLAAELYVYWYERARFAEWLHWTDAYAHAPVPDPVRAVLLGGGAYACISSFVDDALDRARRAGVVADRIDDPRARGRARLAQGIVVGYVNAPQGVVLLEEAAAAARDAGDLWIQLDALASVQFYSLLAGSVERSERAAREALDIASRVDNPEALSNGSACMGWSALLEGRFAEAEQWCAQALPLALEIGVGVTIVWARSVMSQARVARGDLDGARALAAEPLPDGADESLAIWTDVVLGLISLAQGDPGEARRHLQRVVDAIGTYRSVLPSWLPVLGEACIACGDLDAARATFGDAMDVSREIESPYYEGRALAGLGRLAHDEALLHDALRLHVATGDRPSVADTLEALARIAASQESVAEAARLFGAAQALRDEMQYVRFPHVQRVYDEIATPLRDRPEWGEGATLSVDEAVAYAQRGRGERKRPSSGWESLTPAELDVVNLAAQGMTNAQIASRLFIAPATAKTHLAHVFAKLRVATRAELAAVAAQRRLG